MKIKIRDHLCEFQRVSYVDENEVKKDDEKEIVDCSLGVNPFGCSEIVNREISRMNVKNISCYPDYPYDVLTEEISKYWSDIADIGSDKIRIGSGSMGVLNSINTLFVSKENSILGMAPQFAEYIADVKSQGGRYEYVELDKNMNYKFHKDKFIEKMSDENGLIYIDNPNNPTGQVIPIGDLKDVIEAAEDKNICVLIDEAFGEFMSKENSAIKLINNYNNLMVTRTFSKGFGIAGARVGYIICNEQLMTYYKKVELPFSISSFSSYIAKIALKDSDFIVKSRNSVKDIKSKIISECKKLKILETSLETPIMTLMYDDKDVNLYNLFRNNNIITECGKCFIGLDKNFVRLRVPKNIDSLIEAIKEIENNL